MLPLYLTAVSQLLCIAVVLIHARGHDPDAEPEAQDEAFTRGYAVDFILGADQLSEERLLGFIELLLELILTPGNIVDSPPQI